MGWAIPCGLGRVGIGAYAANLISWGHTLWIALLLKPGISAGRCDHSRERRASFYLLVIFDGQFVITTGETIQTVVD